MLRPLGALGGGRLGAEGWSTRGAGGELRYPVQAVGTVKLREDFASMRGHKFSLWQLLRESGEPGVGSECHIVRRGPTQEVFLRDRLQSSIGTLCMSDVC